MLARPVMIFGSDVARTPRGLAARYRHGEKFLLSLAIRGS
jgi:hypothetical protein